MPVSAAARDLGSRRGACPASRSPVRTSSTSRIGVDVWKIEGVDDRGEIVDRKKELIITSGGKNISRQHVELDAAAGYAAEHALEADIATLCQDEGIRTLVANAVGRGNEELARVEQIKKHTILPVAWAPGGDEVTPTMKLERRNINTPGTPARSMRYMRRPRVTPEIGETV
jgi:long-subunit acyl-CoA synthetase (AMP-forming)